jgi:peroxiredoxin
MTYRQYYIKLVAEVTKQGQEILNLSSQLDHEESVFDEETRNAFDLILGQSNALMNHIEYISDLIKYGEVNPNDMVIDLDLKHRYLSKNVSI